MARFGLILLAFAAWVPAPAVEVQSLYTAEADLVSDDPEGREAAYANALSQVLSRITGLADPMASPEIAGLFPDPARYVLQFRPGEERKLWISFDGAAIERVLRSAGVTVWGNDRPLTLVWLAVDWGNGEREIVAAGDAALDADAERSIDRNRLLRERVEEAARRRGIPIAFPLLDAQELEQVSFSDVWGGFDDRLLAASQRYDASSVLVGRVSPFVAGGQRWSWYFGGERREWTGEPEEVVARLADSLAAQFAVAPGEALDTFSLTITGIDSIAAFGAVQSYMESIDLVDQLAVDSVQGDSIRYRVSCHGGEERLRRVLELSSVLEPVQAFPAGGTGGTLAFRYRQ
jgi:hypothetical protein